MLKLATALNAWGSAEFETVLKREVTQMDLGLLPLQQALSQSSYTDGADRSVLIISVIEEPTFIRAKTGIFYSGITPGCSCADDPTPMSSLTEYCEVQFDIDKVTATTTITLLPG